MSHYADVILPLALPKRCYTYALPSDLLGQLQPGMRVEVPFGKNKLYSGLVERIHQEKPAYAIKPVLGVLDELSIVNPQQFKLWDWIAGYYAATLGEVMQAALPGHLKLSSETKLVYQKSFGDDFSSLTNDEYLIAEALHLQNEISIDDARKILNKKTVFPVIQRLLQLGVLALREDLLEKFKPKRVLTVQWAASIDPTPEYLKETLASVARYERQHDLLLAFIDLQRRQPLVRRSELLRKTGNVSDAGLSALVKKGVLEVVPSDQSRLGSSGASANNAPPPLAKQQVEALQSISAHFEHKHTVLLQGVTGSGKTRVYVELIRQVIERGGQVLYLMPEIALTTHLTSRLQQMLGKAVMVYHSRVNYNERVELWRAASAGHPVMVTARSGLFLPFQNLQLVVVDEEHDPSYKQYEPAPRYHA
ncbi:MAG: DEAD/DEAH box helicase, partial [Saprospiraceae bacterium]